MERQLTYHQQQEVRDQITGLLTASADWELPPDLVKRQASRELRRAVMELQSSGFGYEEIKKYENRLRQNSIASTVRALKEHFILERIAEEEEIEALSEDIDQEIALLALQQHESPRRIRARMEKRGETDSLRNQIVERKVIDLITEHATFKDKPYEPEPHDTSAVSHVIGSTPSGAIPEAQPGGEAESLRDTHGSFLNSSRVISRFSLIMPSRRWTQHYKCDTNN